MKLRRRRRRTNTARSATLASPRPEPRFRSRLLSPSFLSLPPPSPTSPPLHHSSFSFATDRESNALSYPSPAVSLLPFFFIKLLKQQSVEGRTVAGVQLVDPAVLPNDNIAAPSSPHPCPFIQSGGRPQLPSLGALPPHRAKP